MAEGVTVRFEYSNNSTQHNIYNIKQKVHVHVCLFQELLPKGKQVGSDLKFAYVILYAILRSTVLFPIFNFQVFQLSPLPKSHAINSRDTESKEHCAPRNLMVKASPLAMAAQVRISLPS